MPIDKSLKKAKDGFPAQGYNPNIGDYEEMYSSNNTSWVQDQTAHQKLDALIAKISDQIGVKHMRSEVEEVLVIENVTISPGETGLSDIVDVRGYGQVSVFISTTSNVDFDLKLYEGKDPFYVDYGDYTTQTYLDNTANLGSFVKSFPIRSPYFRVGIVNNETSDITVTVRFYLFQHDSTEGIQEEIKKLKTLIQNQQSGAAKAYVSDSEVTARVEDLIQENQTLQTKVDAVTTRLNQTLTTKEENAPTEYSIIKGDPFPSGSEGDSVLEWSAEGTNVYEFISGDWRKL